MNINSFSTIAWTLHHIETVRTRSSRPNIMEIDRTDIITSDNKKIDKSDYITYESLTLDQKMGLKNEFENNPECAIYKVIQRLWNCKVAIEFFLNDDPDILQESMISLYPKEEA